MTINELQKILEKAINDGKGDYKVVVLWRYRDDGDYSVRYDKKDEYVTPFFRDNEKTAVF